MSVEEVEDPIEAELEDIQGLQEVIRQDMSNFPEVPRKQLIATVPSGEIRIESGADGAFLLFDCDCLDALPYCKAQCCALKGTSLTQEEFENTAYEAEICNHTQSIVLKRDADGYCTYLDRNCRMCSIYDQRPDVCQSFHCTRGASQRGWKLNNYVNRQSM